MAKAATKPRRGGRAARPVPPAQRPLRALDRRELAARFESALAATDGVGAAHCIHELWMRNEPPMNVEAMLERLWPVAGKSVPDWLPMRHVAWLPLAYEVAAQFQAEARGRSNVYLVLLDYADRRGAEPHGVYVGATRYAPAARFDQHKAGVRAAGSVLKRGLEVLTGPVLHLQGISRADATRIEGALAEALRAAGLLVQGGH